MFNENDRIDGMCCVDCAMLLVNGEANADPDWDEVEYLRSITDYHIFVGDCGGFSKSRCDVCMSNLAGDRFEVSMWEVK